MWGSIQTIAAIAGWTALAGIVALVLYSIFNLISFASEFANYSEDEAFDHSGDEVADGDWPAVPDWWRVPAVRNSAGELNQTNSGQGFAQRHFTHDGEGK